MRGDRLVRRSLGAGDAGASWGAGLEVRPPAGSTRRPHGSGGEAVIRLPDPMEHPTCSVEEAGVWLGLGRSAAYEAAGRGEIPTIRFGRSLRVPTAALRRLLALDETASGEAEAPVVPIRRRSGG